VNDVTGLLDVFDQAIARGDGVVPVFDLAAAEADAARIRERRGYLGGTLVMAIAGGTGSGKSSLLNALAGSPIASVSRIRPHTDEPLAWLPADAGGGLDVVLDRLGIERRVPQEEFPALAVLDLPDLDSYAEWHRRMVEDLLPEIDAVIWVVDPEKYHDRVIHDEFLRPLAAFQDQFIFVLNQIDRLTRAEIEAVTEHLQASLEEIGHDGSRLFPVAANPPDGERLGIEALRDHLHRRLDVKRLALSKLIGDVRTAARNIGEAAGVWTGASLDFERRWTTVIEASSEGLLPGTDPGVIEDCLCRIEDFIAALAVEAGGVPAGALREAFPMERISTALEGATAAAERVPPEDGRSRRRRMRRGGPDPRRVAAAAHIDEHVGDEIRALLWERSRFGATLAEVGVVAAEIEAGIGPSR
jgi:GTP-binding protein EngB required for normal cell division